MGSLRSDSLLSTIRHIAIIGGGPTGLAVAKYLLAEKAFDKIDIFEQRVSVEGTWHYSPTSSHDKVDISQTNPVQVLENPIWEKAQDGSSAPQFTTAMYDNLETNIPKPLMQFSDKPFPDETQLFPPRQVVSQYIREYSAEVEHLIQFQTQVQDIRLLSGDCDQWLVKCRQLETGQETEDVYDAVAICTGHYTVPYVPDIPGLKSWQDAYPGCVSHSKLYRTPETFRNKKVVVVGNSASGIDIANQVSIEAQHPLLISQRSESFLMTSAGLPGRLQLRPPIEEFLPTSDGRRAVRFADGQVEENVDSVVFCTGYFYSFPFLPSLHSRLITDGLRVHDMYQHLFHIDHPSLAFLVLPMRVLPFPLSEAQAAVVARLWSGRLTLPSRDQMRDWEAHTLQENGDGKAFHTLNFPKDFNYHNSLCDWASKTDTMVGKRAHRWNEEETWMRQLFPILKRAFAQKGNEKKEIHTVEDLGFNFEAWKREQEGISRLI